MLHQLLLSFIPTCTPLARKAILTLARKGLLHFPFSKAAVDCRVTANKLMTPDPMLPLEEPFQMLLSTNIPTGGLCGEVIRPAVNASPHSLQGQMDKVSFWVAPQLSCRQQGWPFDFLLFNRIVVCLGVLLWGSVEECNVCLSVCHYTSWACPCSCGGLSALQWRVCILGAVGASPAVPG